jgi:predicted SAM-dependent methyltransferase
VITAYQIPSDEQLNMIQKFCEIQGEDFIEVDLYLQKSEKNRDITHYDYIFDSFESFKSKMLKLRYSPRNLDQDAIRRIQLLQSFRNDSDFENPKPDDFVTKPKPASELGRKLTREEIQDILKKYPALRNMEKSARNRAIIRIADYFDSNNCYQQSDWVMEMVDEV